MYILCSIVTKKKLCPVVSYAEVEFTKKSYSSCLHKEIILATFASTGQIWPSRVENVAFQYRHKPSQKKRESGQRERERKERERERKEMREKREGEFRIAPPADKKKENFFFFFALFLSGSCCTATHSRTPVLRTHQSPAPPKNYLPE